MPTISPSISATALATYRAARRRRAQLARNDVHTFVPFVLRDEDAGGAQVVQAPFHTAMQDLITENSRVILWKFVEGGGSQQLIGRILFEIQKNPALRVGWFSASDGQAVKVVRSIGKYISSSPEFRMVAPAIRPGTPWNDSAITVARKSTAKDATVQGFGLLGHFLGSRLDWAVIDDVVNFENSRSELQRRTVYDWVLGQVVGRMNVGGHIVFLGNCWDPRDAMHELARNPAWASARFPIQDDAGNPTWPARWPRERIAQRRAELGPFAAARQLDCFARDEESARFQQSWIQAAIDRGRHVPAISYLANLGPDCRVYIGVDIATSQRKGADKSAIAAVLVHGQQLDSEYGLAHRIQAGDRQLLEITSGQWTTPDLIQRIHFARNRFKPAAIVVETAGQQDLLRQILRSTTDLPIVGFQTGRGKMSLQAQAELLAVELANAKWLIPSGDDGKQLSPEMNGLVRDMLFYSPDAHTPDRLSALLLARAGIDRGGGAENWNLNIHRVGLSGLRR